MSEQKKVYVHSVPVVTSEGYAKTEYRIHIDVPEVGIIAIPLPDIKGCGRYGLPPCDDFAEARDPVSAGRLARIISEALK